MFNDLGPSHRELGCRIMKLSTIIAIIGAFVAMVFAFENLGQYLIGSSNWYVFWLLMLIACAVGALPGLIIGWITGDGKKDKSN
jgi:ABC-type branched-subunit amino acid transport system permease subunit